MAAKKTEPAAETFFFELLRQQIDILTNGVYEYQHLYIFTAGSDEPWIFGRGAEIDIREEQDLLVARDGPSDEQGNEDVPEYVIRLNAIVGSQLVV